MANGLLDQDPPLQSPFQSPLESGFSLQPTPGRVPSQQVSQPIGETNQPGGFTGPGGMNRLNQIYGLLAQYGDDPMQAMQGYVGAMQRQQQLDYQRSPQARLERSIGPLTPGHYTEESLQKYWNELQTTGDRDYSLLERHEALTDRETGLIDTAMQGAYKAETMMNRASRLANGFLEAARAGQASGIIADLQRFGARILGTQGAADKLFMELDQLANEEIIQNLPPGVASDRDIEIAMRGRPPATANPAYVAAWLNGKVKQNAIKHAYQTFRADYLSRNKTMAGFPQAWNEAREAITMRALQRAGGLYAPVDEQGNLLDPEQAAMQKYGQMFQQGLPQIMPGQASPTQVTGPTVRTTPAAAAGEKRSRQSIVDEYTR